MAPLLAEAVRECEAPVILDCGCGTGHNVGMLRQYGRAVGIDLTWSGLAYAHRHGRAVRRPGHRDAAARSRIAASTSVTSFDVIYALDDQSEAAALAEMFRVLRPGGTWCSNVAAMDLLKGNHSVLSHEIRRYSRGSLTERLTNVGLPASVACRIPTRRSSRWLPGSACCSGYRGTRNRARKFPRPRPRSTPP